LLYQLPLLVPSGDFQNLGLHKIWGIKESAAKGGIPALSLEYFKESIINKDQYGKLAGLQFQEAVFYQIVLNCMIIAVIFLQSDIFNSAGYKKFVT